MTRGGLDPADRGQQAPRGLGQGGGGITARSGGACELRPGSFGKQIRVERTAFPHGPDILDPLRPLEKIEFGCAFTGRRLNCGVERDLSEPDASGPFAVIPTKVITPPSSC